MERFVGVLSRAGLARLVLVSAACTGCGVTRQITVSQMVPILEHATEGARERTDLQLISQALPANLLLIDGLIRTSPKNAELLTLASFLHFGYALGFVEADSLELAGTYYAAGRDYGLRALGHRRPFQKGSTGTLEEFTRGVASLQRSDVAALAWTSANWGRWISLNLESPAAIAQQPRFEAMVSRLLQLDPDYEAGLPHVLRGMYDALRPKPLGGQPDSAQAHFQKAFAIDQGRNLLYQVLYAEFYCRQVMDTECFDTNLEAVAAAKADADPAYRLMNEIARRRAARLQAQRDDLF